MISFCVFIFHVVYLQFLCVRHYINLIIEVELLVKFNKL